MTTALDIIRSALEFIGVYAPGEVISDSDAQRGLVVLNDMLDSWSNESLSTFAILEQSLPLVVGQQAYTIGPGGNLNATRPIRLIDGPGAAYIMDTNLNRYPVDVVPKDKWNLIGLLATTSNIPDTIYYDNQNPLGILNVFPIPNISYTLFFDSYLQLADLAALTTAVSLPVGYNDAVKKCLGVELWPYFKTGEIGQSVLMLAAKAKGNVKRSNMRPVEAVFDPEIVSNAARTYNIYRDTP
jgi:hypothetical protein